MKRIIPFRSLNSHIIVYFSVIFIIVISIIVLVGYNYFSNVLTGEILKYSSKIADEAKNNIDSYFSQIKTLIQITAVNNDIFEGIKTESINDYSSKLFYNRRTDDILQDMLKFNSKIKDFIIVRSDGTAYDNSGSAVKSDYNFFKQKWFPVYKDNFAKVRFIGIHAQDYYVDPTAGKGNVVSAVIPILDHGDPTRRNYATLICNLNIKDIQEVTKDTVLEKTGFFLIMDDKNEIIYSPYTYNIDNRFKIALKNELKKGKDSFFLYDKTKKDAGVYKTSMVTSWKVIAIIPMNEILKHLGDIKSFTFILIVICVLVVIITSVLISGRITKPLTRLMNRMSNIEKGDFGVRLYDDSTVEIEMLSKRMDIMVERINSLNKDIYSYRIKTKEAEIKALQEQINPHFLYNTLQAIKALAVCERTSDISRIVNLIGNMLRYAVYNIEDLVPVQSEIDHVTDYLKIQNYRYPNQLTYEINCIPELSHKNTIKLILQPIVENAILHGLRVNESGFIQINIERTKEGILISVHDNGNGMDGEKVEEVRLYLNDPTMKENSNSIGLKNVHERIRLKFGNIYGLKITSQKNVGTCVKILVPEIDN